MSLYPVYEEVKNVNMVVMQYFHNYTMLFLILILSLLLGLLFMKIICKFTNKTFLTSQMLEVIWTILPMIILVLIALPSLFYLYLMDLSCHPALTLKVFGVQWYWIYEYSDVKTWSVGSYIIKDDSLLSTSPFLSGWRLLECDTRGVLPFGVEIRALITSQDVIHSFSIPSLGVKVDAVPGRLNWTTIFNSMPGTLYGQCTEICGVGHAFMPIVIDFINLQDFIKVLEESSHE